MSKKSLYSLLASLLVLGLMLSACAPAPAEEPVVEEPVVEEPVEEPTAEPTEVVVEFSLDPYVAEAIAGWDHYNTISPADVNTALAEKDVFLIDVREPSELAEKGYIEGAINIPLRTLFDDPSLLPALDTYIVLYCGSGARCTQAMAYMSIAGYTDAWTMVGNSFGGWVSAGFPVVTGEIAAPEAINAVEFEPALLEAIQNALHGIPEGFAQVNPADVNALVAEDENTVIIDVRKPEELEADGFIAGAVNIQLETMIDRIAEWPADLDTPIVVYCKAGTRGQIAMSILRTYGYTNVVNIKGGFDGWKNAGLAYEGGVVNLDSRATAFLAAMESYNTIQPADVNTLLAEGEEIVLIDVREVSELEEKGWIEGAINIPLRTLLDDLTLLPPFDAQVIVYCGSGVRCTQAMTYMGLLGYKDVKTMVGGSFGGWLEAGYPVVTGEIPAPTPFNAITADVKVVEQLRTAMQNIPDGFGQVAPADLNTEIIDGGEFVIFDVRTAEEVAETGTLEGAINLPIIDFVAMKDQWPAELDTPIIVTCKSGTRGLIAMSILRAYGYTDVRNIKGGIDAWIAAALPVVK